MPSPRTPVQVEAMWSSPITTLSARRARPRTQSSTEPPLSRRSRKTACACAMTGRRSFIPCRPVCAPVSLQLKGRRRLRVCGSVHSICKSCRLATSSAGALSAAWAIGRSSFGLQRPGRHKKVLIRRSAIATAGRFVVSRQHPTAPSQQLAMVDPPQSGHGYKFRR
jgi:hypothetical protein